MSFDGKSIRPHHPKSLMSARRQSDQHRTRICLVGRTHDVSVRVQSPNCLRHRLPAYAEPIGQIRRMQRACGQRHKSNRLCRS